MNVVLFLIVALFWGGSFVAIEPLVKIVPPITAAALRIGVAILCLVFVLPILKVSFKVPKKIQVKVWITGLFAFTFPFALLFWGEQSVSPGLAGILNGTVPIFVFLLGMIFTPGIETITVKKVVGLIVGILGVVVIFYPKLNGGMTSSLAGAVAILLMACSYAASALLNRNLFTQHKQMHPLTNLFNQLISGFILIAIIALTLEGIPQFSTYQPVDTFFATVLYLGAGSTAIAFICFYRLIQSWGAVRASTVTYVIPATALVLDLILNRKIPSPTDLLGVIAITAGVLILNVQNPFKRNTTKRSGTKH